MVALHSSGSGHLGLSNMLCGEFIRGSRALVPETSSHRTLINLLPNAHKLDPYPRNLCHHRCQSAGNVQMQHEDTRPNIYLLEYSSFHFIFHYPYISIYPQYSIPIYYSSFHFLVQFPNLLTTPIQYPNILVSILFSITAPIEPY